MREPVDTAQRDGLKVDVFNDNSFIVEIDATKNSNVLTRQDRWESYGRRLALLWAIYFVWNLIDPLTFIVVGLGTLFFTALYWSLALLDWYLYEYKELMRIHTSIVEGFEDFPDYVIHMYKNGQEINWRTSLRIRKKMWRASKKEKK